MDSRFIIAEAVFSSYIFVRQLILDQPGYFEIQECVDQTRSHGHGVFVNKAELRLFNLLKSLVLLPKSPNVAMAPESPNLEHALEVGIQFKDGL